MAARIRPVRESDIQKQLLLWLALHPQEIPLFWRNNTGARTLPGNKGKGQFVRWGRVGSGDILFLTATGRFGSIECKRPGGKPTDAQKDWMNRVNAAGGLALIARSVEDLEAALRVEGVLP